MALISAAAVAVVVVVAVVLAQAVARRELLREIDQSLVDRIAAIERFPANDRVGDLIGRDQSRRGFGPDSIFGRGESGFDALFFQFVDGTGRTITAAGQALSLPVDASDIAIASGSRRRFAPVAALLDIGRWREGERRDLVEVIRAKAGRSERDFIARYGAHPRLDASLVAWLRVHGGADAKPAPPPSRSRKLTVHSEEP